MKKSSRPYPKSEIWLKRIAWSLLFLLIVMIVAFSGYWIGYNQAEETLLKEREQNELLVQQIKEIAQIDDSLIDAEKFEESKKESEIRHLKKELHELLERERSRDLLKPQHEYAPKDQKASPPPPIERPISNASGAKLVIIIDDVSYARDIRAIQSTHLPVVMSFLPPSSKHPESAKLASSYSNSMVHLPLEALDYDSEEPITLKINDSEDVIAKRIVSLKRLYPHIRYMNNHTGSKFTSDSAAMDRLIRVMKKEGLQFVDSRTTAKTKVADASRRFGMRYLGRDVFLDHEDGVDNIKGQIREAVEKARRHGSAIAIGHPRPDTIQALKESKDILNSVHLVGIEQI